MKPLIMFYSCLAIHSENMATSDLIFHIMTMMLEFYKEMTGIMNSRTKEEVRDTATHSEE